MALTEDRFLLLMEMMNEKQCKEIESRVAGQLESVKKDLTGAIDKVNKRQDTMETEQNELKDQMGNMHEKIEEIKKITQAAQTKQASEKVNSCSVGRSYAAAASIVIQDPSPNPDP